MPTTQANPMTAYVEDCLKAALERADWDAQEEIRTMSVYWDGLKKAGATSNTAAKQMLGLIFDLVAR